MSYWRRLSSKHRTLYLTMAILALAATALASSRLRSPWKAIAMHQEKSEDPVSLGGTLPPQPAEVFIQKTDRFPELGNVLVTVQLTPEQVARKVEEGTASFTTAGSFGQVLFRDDGESGDAVAGDALYTAVAQIDPEDLEKRGADDAAAIETVSAEIPLFAGRVLTGSQTQAAFDIGGFNAGRAVRMTRPVVDVEPFDPGPHEDPPIVDRVSDFQKRVLMIRHPGVVGDPTRTIDPCNPGSGSPNGVWTFKYLMTELASTSGLTPSEFTERWLKNWTTGQAINGVGVPSRLAMQSILDDWHDVSGGPGSPLDLDQAPLRLRAIVPRLDLRQSQPGGGAFLDAGEVRFVFVFVRPPFWFRTPRPPSGYGTGGSCPPLPFTVIFEYRIPRTTCSEVTRWAKAWLALDNLTLGTEDYNSRLEQLTAGSDATHRWPTRILGQVRTNEIALEDPWQLREFRLNYFPVTQLWETTTRDTAADSFNNTTVFQSWILSQIAPSLSGPSWDQPIPGVPLSYSASSFLGARPEVPTSAFIWNAPGLDLNDNTQNWARHRASLASCNSCHGGETRTDFVHVDPVRDDPASPGQALLSRFLTGITLNDPAHGSPSRSFSDLARRERDIRDLSRTMCAMFPPVDVSYVRAELVKTGKLPLDPFPGDLSSDQLLSVALDDLKANHVTEVH